jgi:two-component system, cell cycle response regulator
MRILIADDSVVSRHLLEAALRKLSYEVIMACDGAEAWNVLQSDNPPRIAILDWVMPGLSGPEVCRRVRERSRDSESTYTYVLLLTSKSQTEDLIEGMESGADDYLVKPFNPDELRVRLRSGSRIIDLQRQLVTAREELREQATKDFLTRLWNRSSILDILQRELTRAARESRNLGVVLADLDSFKTINDTYGHFAGDAVLREFSRRMLFCMRSYDAIGRYGGEEFLVVLPGCDEHCTATQAERMRVTLAGEPMLINEIRYESTCSFGGTSWHPGMPQQVENLIRICDKALYMAKNQGRDRVVMLPSVGVTTAR